MSLALQLLCHAWGDYVLQTDRMANEKTRSSLWAAFHAAVYCVPFAIALAWQHRLGASMAPIALFIMYATHVLIDRFRLARYVVQFKNWATDRTPGRFATPTGYPAETPAFLSTWLLIIADNVLHVTINALALLLVR